MADYHAILKRTISALPNPNGEARRAVYEKARTALVNQLKSFDPPLSPSEITQQRLHLEEAIRKVESEAAKGLLKAPPAAPPVVATPAAPHSAPHSAVVAPAAAEPTATPLATAHDAPAAHAPKPITRPLERTVEEAGHLGTAAAELGRQARDALAEAPAAPPSPAPASTASATVVTSTPVFGRDDAEPIRKRETDERRRRRDQAVKGERGPSRLPVVVGITAAILVFVVGIVALWTQREAISALFGSGEPVVDLAKRPTGEKHPPKVTDRLGSDDATRPAGPVKQVSTQTITPGAPQLANEQGAAMGGTGGMAGMSGMAGMGGMASAPLPTAPQAVALVAQKAILYEEGKAGAQALISPGKVIWQLVPDPTDPKPGAQALKVQVDIPDRRFAATLTMRPNADTSFPASHMIEVRFSLPPDFDGKSVSNLPGLILKATEQSRGDPLTAAAARVADNFFWVALGAAEQDRARNLKLVRERGWIDVPILFENGRRAILTIEKSGAGDQVVTDALAGWGQGG